MIGFMFVIYLFLSYTLFISLIIRMQATVILTIEDYRMHVLAYCIYFIAFCALFNHIAIIFLEVLLQEDSELTLIYLCTLIELLIYFDMN